jgi:hypothetical protein
MSKYLGYILILLLTTHLGAQEQRIDTQRSVLTIHVGKGGLLSAAGHEHWVRAPFSEGSFNPNAPAHVEFKVDARALTVMPDEQLSADKQAEVQKTMQTEVLESDKYPEILFRSTRIEQSQADHWLVTGDLSLHGQTRPIHVDVRADGDAYKGSARFKQTDFGIRPVSVGGLVKVKNELDIQFTVVSNRSRTGF